MQRTDDSMLTAEELRLRNRKRRIWFVLGVAFILVLALGFFFGKPTAHAIKAFQARRHANKAFALIEQEKWKEARDEASAAYQLYPSEPQATRAVARFLSRVRNPEALEFWKKLGEQSQLTRQDLRDEASIALAVDELERAKKAIEALIANDGKEATPADWLLAALCAQRRNTPQDAQRFLQKVFDDSRTNDREKLQAALLELQIGSASEPAVRERLTNDAWLHISKIAQGKNAESLDALVLLAQRELGGKVESRNEKVENQKSEVGHQGPDEELVGQLENHPLAKTAHKLIAVDLRIKETPADKEALVAEAIAQFRNGDDDSVKTLGTWLNEHREFERELEAIPRERAIHNRELFLIHLDALAALARWSEVKQLLEREGFPLEQFVQQMYLARCTAQLGETTAAANNWQRALESTGGDVQKLLQLADFAEKNGAVDIAGAAYDSAVTQNPKLRIAQQGRLRVAQAKRDTKRMHGVLAEMLKLWPNDTAIQNDEAYTRLLLMGSQQSQVESSVPGGREMDGNAGEGAGEFSEKTNQGRKDKVENQKSDVGDGKAGSTSAPDVSTLNSQPSTSSELIAIEKLASDLARREPSSLPHRTLLALALLRQQRPVAALDVYNGINVSPNALTPSALAVHAAVLAANGQLEDAKKEFAQLKFENLLPEEQAATADLKN